MWQRLGLRWNPFRSWDDDEAVRIWACADVTARALLDLARGGVVELVGKEGSGKTITALALAHLAEERGIPARYVYLPPGWSYLRLWLPTQKGTLLLVDECERLIRTSKLFLTLHRLSDLYGIVFTRHPSRSEAKKQMARWTVRLRRLLGVPYRLVYLPGFDAERIATMYRVRMRRAGALAFPELDPAACRWLAAATGGNGRLVQWALFELFQTTANEAPSRLTVAHVRRGFERHQRSRASEKAPPLAVSPGSTETER